MTWLSHKIIIFVIFKIVKAWGRKTEKFRGENKQVLRNNCFFPLGFQSSLPLIRADHYNEHRFGIYSEIALGGLGLKIIVIFKNRFHRCLEPSTIQFTLSHKPWIMLWKKMDGLVLPAWFSIPETCSSVDSTSWYRFKLKWNFGIWNPGHQLERMGTPWNLHCGHGNRTATIHRDSHSLPSWQVSWSRCKMLVCRSEDLLRR